MDHNSAKAVEIRVTQNGYLLVLTGGCDPIDDGRYRFLTCWTFETLPALMKELPRIMAFPKEASLPKHLQNLKEKLK